MAEKKAIARPLLVALSAIGCLLGAAALVLALTSMNKQRDLRDDLDDVELRAAQRYQALHDRDTQLTAERAGETEAVRQSLPPIEERLDELEDRFDRLPVQPAEEPGPSPSRGQFTGSGGNAHHIVFLVERTTALVEGGRFEVIRNELKVFISRLDDKQDFHVIFYGGPELLETPGDGLVFATPVNRRTAQAFLDAVGLAGEQANLAPALDRAIRLLAATDVSRPGRIIYIVAGTPPADASQAIELVSQHVVNDQTLFINTFLVGPDDSTLGETLKQLSSETEGRFKHITPEQIAEKLP